jgi:hypothetical protein
VTETLGVGGVCHLLADAARLREKPLRRSEAVRWAVDIGVIVVDTTVRPSMDPATAVREFLRRRGVRSPAVERTSLPGAPCATCIATQLLPAAVAADVVHIAQSLGCAPAQAFEWASRVGAIVLSHRVTDKAEGPADALSAMVMGEYVHDQRQLRCDLQAA